MRGGARLRRALGRTAGRELPPELVRLTDEDRRYLESLYDDRLPLPPGADRELAADHPRLRELREAYAALDVPATDASRWDRGAVEEFFDLRHFRGESLVYWHYRELPRIDRLKFFVFAQYVRSIDSAGLLDRLEEDGAFGCWTYEYADGTLVSRDLLESVAEMQFLDEAARCRIARPA